MIFSGSLQLRGPTTPRRSWQSWRAKGTRGGTYELAGDEAWPLSGPAAETSRQAGKTIPRKDLPEDLAQAIAGWDVGASQGALFEDGRQLSAPIGRPTPPLSAAVGDALKQVA